MSMGTADVPERDAEGLHAISAARFLARFAVAPVCASAVSMATLSTVASPMGSVAAAAVVAAEAVVAVEAVAAAEAVAAVEAVVAAETVVAVEAVVAAEEVTGPSTLTGDLSASR